MPRNIRTLTLALLALTLAAVPAVSLAKHRARPAQAATQSVGSVVSFSGDVLAVEVADGSTISGRVGPRTRIGCSRGPRAHVRRARTARHGGRAASGATGPVGAPEHGSGAGRRLCDLTAVKVGTKVLAASVVLTPDGPVWRLVVFLTPDPVPSGTTGPADPLTT